MPNELPIDKDLVVEYSVQYGTPAVGALLVLFVVWIGSRIASGLVTRGLTKAKFDATLTKFFAKLVRWLVLLAGFVSVLGMFGVETTSFAAIIGAAGLAVGLALQGTLSNFASGVMLLIFRPFGVGNFVNIAGQSGTVNEIDLFTTTLDTPDNRRIIIPNSEIYGATIENITFNSKRRAEVLVGVEYGADIDKTREVLEKAAANVLGALDDPEPQVSLLELGGSSVDWSVRVWAPTSDFWNVKQAATRAVKIALDEAGIGIPYPTMDVNLSKVDQNG